MNQQKRIVLLLLAVAGLAGVAKPVYAVQADESDAGAALDLLFEQERETKRIVARAFLQRTSFSGLLESSKKNLQIAFVIDGTDSMGKDIASVVGSLENMARDIRQKRGGSDDSQVSFSVVVFRDSGSDSGTVVVPQGKEFTPDVLNFRSTLAEIRTESGRPDFSEAVDAGIHTALESLNWKLDGDTSRWIIVFSDAPPHAEAVNGQPNPNRHFSNQKLIDLAVKKNISISSVLCASGFIATEDTERNRTLADIYQQALPYTREFMQELAEKTHGAYLDLSQPKLREQLAEAAQAKQRVQSQPIEAITPRDLETAIAAANSKNRAEAEINRQRIVVLPHLPLGEMSFDSEAEAVQVAAELRHKLRLIRGFDVCDAATTQQSFENLAMMFDADNVAEALHQMAWSCDADWVIWGEIKREGKIVRLTSHLYRKVDGEKLASATQLGTADEFTRSGSELGERNLVVVVADELLKKSVQRMRSEGNYPETTITAFEYLDADKPTANQFRQPIASSIRARRELLTGLDLLEKSLGVSKGDANGQQYLEGALRSLQAAASLDAENPIIYSALASTHLNLASLDANDDNVTRSFKALEKARRFLDKTTLESLRLEVNADYNLLVKHDYRSAERDYLSIINLQSAPPLNAVLRAHWMLAGMYCGDWGAKEVVSADAARHHIIQILALWPQSPEAAYYRTALDWSNDSGSRINAIPRNQVGFDPTTSGNEAANNTND